MKLIRYQPYSPLFPWSNRLRRMLDFDRDFWPLEDRFFLPGLDACRGHVRGE